MGRPEPQEILEALPHPALLIGATERISAANVRAVRLFGPGLLNRHYIAALRQPPLLEAIDAVRDGGDPRSARYLGREGSRDTVWAAHVSSAGSETMISFEDRTHAEEAGQMRRDFVANVSHELKTPLTAMMGFIETLLGPARQDETARDRFLRIMEAEARRMNRLVQDLLSLSRVEADERVRPRDPVEITGLVGSALHMLAGAIAESGKTVSWSPPEDPLQMTGDPDQLRQIFANLVENALKYGGDHVTLTAGREQHVRELRGPGLIVTIHDNGPGIDAVHLPRLSERFYRVDTHRSRSVGGTGLGLAIVKHIVSRHRGRLRISSAAGEGSTFTILLPLDRED